MAVVSAACRKALVNDRWVICLLSYINGHRKCSFHLVGTLFWHFRQLLVQRSALWSEGPDY